MDWLTTTLPAWWVFALFFLALVLILNYVGIRLAIGLMLTLRRDLVHRR